MELTMAPVSWTLIDYTAVETSSGPQVAARKNKDREVRWQREIRDHEVRVAIQQRRVVVGFW
jgi:hypothetical protein